jgi:DNA-directed RNA polymerase specialized sigma24 family protein/uncharacterized protein YndB with AHSA1/START domain
MTVTDDVELDLLEQCRAGDRAAFRALVAFWGAPALRLATTFTNDDERARAALAEALIECWRQLPSLHSDTPFRPFLFGLVSRAALAHGSAGGTGRLDRGLDMLEPDSRAAAILHGHGHLSASEVARALGTSTLAAMRATRDGMRSLQASLGFKQNDALSAASSDAHLDRRFFDEVLSPELEDRWLLEVRRIVQRPRHDAWGVLTDPTAIPAWISAARAHVRGGGALHPGGHIAARGRIADRRPSRDESIITLVEPPGLLAWTTRSRITPLHAPIEFRWSVVIDEVTGGSELHHRLRGVAFPHGLVGRFLRGTYDRVAGSMQPSMHRGLERLSSLIEARPV